MPTAHNSAQKGDFAKTVLMPGDPYRAKFIAENFLENAKLVNEVRGALGYTGTYKGKPVSVMASGMGLGSIGIYSYELFRFYDVDNIIRVGSCGAFQDNQKLLDVVVAMAASTDSDYSHMLQFEGHLSPVCSYELLAKTAKTAEKLGTPIQVGSVFSSDVFYFPDETEEEKAHTAAMYQRIKELGFLGVEMETAALYWNAMRLHKNALTILSVSNHMFRTEEDLSAEERQTGFGKMIELALETV